MFCRILAFFIITLNFCSLDAHAQPEMLTVQGWGKGWMSESTGDYSLGEGPGIDVDGQVGYRLFVKGPRVKCDQHWHFNYKIISGTLPPGLTIVEGPCDIEGIPTERGNWVVKIQIFNVTCGTQPIDLAHIDYDIQEIRFHIAGSGKVIQ